MNKILMSSPEKTSIINDGKYRFSEDTTLTLEVEDFSKDIFLSVTSHKKVVFNLFSKNSTLNFHIQILKGAEFVFNYFSIKSLFLERCTQIISPTRIKAMAGIIIKPLLR